MKAVKLLAWTICVGLTFACVLGGFVICANGNMWGLALVLACLIPLTISGAINDSDKY